MPFQTLLMLASLFIATVFYPAAAISDALVIPDISNQPSNTPEGVPRPTRSMTMDQVREQFGNPLEVHGPVGNPPITRWVYDKFVVHFEGEYVIHSVVKRNQ